MAEVSNSKLFQTKEDIRDLQDVLVVLIKTEWNARIVDELEQGCLKVLKDHRIRTSSLVVPGAVEIPFAIQQSWHHSQEARAYIALGCVIRGGTPHFEYVCQSV